MRPDVASDKTLPYVCDVCSNAKGFTALIFCFSSFSLALTMSRPCLHVNSLFLSHSNLLSPSLFLPVCMSFFVWNFTCLFSASSFLTATQLSDHLLQRHGVRRHPSLIRPAKSNLKAVKAGTEDSGNRDDEDLNL
jgi:hypothetical protein